MAPAPCNGSTFDLLRSGAGARLDALEQKSKQRIFFNSSLDGMQNKIGVLRSRLANSRVEDEVFEVMSGISRLERGAGAKQGAICAINGIIKPSGKKVPFFDYMLEEEMPSCFVEKAVSFREEIGSFGWSMQVDSGIVIANGYGGKHQVAGHLVRAFSIQPAVHSEFPKWKRRGKGSLEPLSCSIKFTSGQLGIDYTQARGFAYAEISRSDDWSQALFGHMESKFRVAGFAFELNEDGRRVHMYFIGKGGAAVATLFDGKLEVPPQAWQE
ncbi:MAG TPA: hypothetical protein PLO51_00885 [Candidatus Micrarchaeota archaeon]|nr:hypothetical protein [Candidatus Micrarchaeota archaeon]